MMKPGVRAHDYGRSSAASLFGAISADGWQTVQLACKKALTGCDSAKDLTDAFIGEIRQALADSGLTVGVLGCYVEPSLADDTERRRHVDDFRSHLSVAKALNAGCIGTETTNMGSQKGVTRKEALVCLRRSMEAILPEAERLGVTVAVEPVYYHAMATPEDTRDLLKDMASNRLKVIFDPVNLLSPEEIADQERLWNRCMDCFGGDIAAVHIKGMVLKDGAPVPSGLRESLADWNSIFARLRGLSRDLPVLREEAVPSNAADDIAFIRSLF